MIDQRRTTSTNRLPSPGRAPQESPKRMSKSVLVSVMCALVFAQYSDGLVAGETATESALTAALHAAKEDEGHPFRLDVHCNNGGQIRSLDLYRGTIAVLNRTRQVTLKPGERAALLDKLLDAGFPSFEESYGGRPKTGKQEAPLKVSCRIALEIDGMKKSSFQLASMMSSASCFSCKTYSLASASLSSLMS